MKHPKITFPRISFARRRREREPARDAAGDSETRMFRRDDEPALGQSAIGRPRPLRRAAIGVDRFLRKLETHFTKVASGNSALFASTGRPRPEIFGDGVDARGLLTRSSLRRARRRLSALRGRWVNRTDRRVGSGEWTSGIALAPAGLRNYYLFSPPDVRPDERLPLLVMLHGCKQDATEFARSTRMNRLAARERFFVLYPEQDRLANPHACWNWFDTSLGKAYGEVEILKAAVDQVCLHHPVDRDRVAVAGLSAGASIGALLVTRYPERFNALIMHSGVPPGTAYSPATALDAMLGTREPAALPKSPLPPLLVIHGGSDDVVAASNALAVARVWADAAGARAGVVRRVQRRGRHEMTSTDFIVEGRTAATLCEVAKLGHAWSGGDARFSYTDPRGPDASSMVWAFVDRHSASRLPAKAATARPNQADSGWPWNRAA